jgi:hypothetical protein
LAPVARRESNPERSCERRNLRVPAVDDPFVRILRGTRPDELRNDSQRPPRRWPGGINLVSFPRSLLLCFPRAAVPRSGPGPLGRADFRPKTKRPSGRPEGLAISLIAAF